MDLDKWLEEIVNDYIYDDVTELNGVMVCITTYSYHYDNDVSQTMYLPEYDVTYKRTGYKIISYERYIDDHWYDWEIDN